MTLPALTTNATNPNVFIHDGKAVTTSQAVAEYFTKRHDNVIQKIERLDCSPEFHHLNFKEMSNSIEIGNGATRESKIYEMTKDGFVFLVMGFTGKKAAAFKEAYIAEFNRMESELSGNVKQIAPTVSQEEIDAYNVNALLTHYRLIYTEWKESIYPALKKLESPLASRLCNHYQDGFAFLMHLEKSLNSRLTSNQRPRIY